MSSNSSNTIRKADLIYYAGLFDAIGYIKMDKAGIYAGMFATHKSALEDICYLFGGNIVLQDYTRRSPLPGNKPLPRNAYHWQITDSDAIYFLDTIVDYLRFKHNKVLAYLDALYASV